MDVREPHRCPACKHGRTVEIALRLGGREVRLVSCSACDSRWWRTDGQAAALTDVLALAASSRR
jgi:transposase-like protein